MNLCAFLIRHTLERPDAPALIEPRGAGERTVTYRELDDRSARAARLLRDQGLGEGERVLVLHPLSIELYVALIAIFRIGAVATLIDPSAGRAHLRASLRRARPRAFFGSGRAQLLRLVTPELWRTRPVFTTGIAVPGVVAWRRLEDTEPLRELTEVTAEHGALLTFTSGSTGAPKATLRSHRFLLAQHRALERAIDLRAGEVDLATLPVFVLANLASGVTTLLPRADLRRPGQIDPRPIRDQLRHHRPTRVEASPAFFERLLGGATNRAEDGPQELAELRCFEKVFTGGAPVFPRLLFRLAAAIPDARLVAVFGSTEAEPIAHIDWSEITPADLEAMYAGRGLLTGPPVPEIEVRIAGNRSGTPVPTLTETQFEEWLLPPGQPGEILVQGDHVVEGYLEGIGDDETKCTVDGRRWHRTGDAGYLDGTGRLWLLGRARAVIEDARGTLHPFAVECAATRFPWIVRSALAARDGSRILALELADPPSAWETQVRQSLHWAELDRLVQVPRIPVDRRHNAKVDYIALDRLLEST